MSDELKKTIRIHRGQKVGTDEQGRSVWTKPVESIELELVDTVMLRKVLESDDEEKKRRIRSLANEGDGLLGRTTESQDFEIISDEELEMALSASDQVPEFTRPADVVLEPASSDDGEEELSLVSTQLLRQMLSHDDDEAAGESGDPEEQGGYNPYDRG